MNEQAATHLDLFWSELQEVLPADALSRRPEDLRLASRDRSEWGESVPPFALISPATVAEVQDFMRVAWRHRVPVVPRGAGTGLSGGANAIENCVILSLARMNRILSLHPDDGYALVEPGVINADVSRAAKAVGMRFAPDPSSAAISTIGGNIATNAGGLRCIKYGVTRDAVLGLLVVLANGETMRLGGTTLKGVSGLDLTSLMVGSEGTLGIIVEATVRLIPEPADVATLVAMVPGFGLITASVLAVIQSGVTPSMVEFLDHGALARRDLTVLDALGLQSEVEGASLLLVQTDGLGAPAELRAIDEALLAIGAVTRPFLSDQLTDRVLAMRRGADSGVGPTSDTSKVLEQQVEARPDEWALSEDMAVPRSRIAEFFLTATELCRARGVNFSAVAHIGDGNLHPLLTLERTDHSESEARSLLFAAADDLVRLALALGGTITGEHGIGTLKREWLPLELDPRSRRMQKSVKALFDPRGILNPGKGY